ncbi:MAG: DUF2947 family protein [Polyangiaceae bacterium]|nr:DUF2947 family protein [Polyangiaceae bacterium]
METRPLDSARDWAFFDADERPSAEDAVTIRPLTEPAARAVWARLISGDASERHPMLLGPDRWLRPATCAAPNWVDVWNAPRTEPDPITAFLTELLQWPPSMPILFFWMRERVVSVPWAVFLRTWRLFLFDDEAPFFLSLEAPQVVTFYPRGRLGLCARPGHRPPGL